MEEKDKIEVINKDRLITILIEQSNKQTEQNYNTLQTLKTINRQTVIKEIVIVFIVSILLLLM